MIHGDPLNSLDGITWCEWCRGLVGFSFRDSRPSHLRVEPPGVGVRVILDCKHAKHLVVTPAKERAR